MLLLDKPFGISSHAALTRAKILFDADKAGHTGTLDPFASGLLPVCFGEATKFAGFMLDANKTYEATVRLGQTTSTGDREGKVLAQSSKKVTPGEVAEALDRFTGRMSQLPPMHSAIKFEGQPLYRLARQGIEVPRQARDITIHALDLLAFEPPLMKIRVVSSKGTYIRVLAEDIGKVLDCGGMLEDLRRTHIGNLSLTAACTLDELSEMPAAARDARLAPADCLVLHLPPIQCNEQMGRSLLEGRIERADVQPGCYRAYATTGEFLGLVEATMDGIIKPQRMMARPLTANKDSPNPMMLEELGKSAL